MNKRLSTLSFKLTRYINYTMKHQTDLKKNMDYNRDILEIQRSLRYIIRIMSETAGIS